MTEFNDIVDALARGDFSVKSRLRELLLLTCNDPSSQVAKLWSHVATHSETSVFAELLPELSDERSIRRTVVALGLTLSPAAVPILWQYRDAFDSPALDPYVALALNTILEGQDAPEANLAEPTERSKLEGLTQALNPTHYYYHGQPAFAGDLSKELIVVTTTAFKERRAISIAYQAELLEAFSGARAPVERGQNVDDAALGATFGYVKSIAAMSWSRGSKYFHQHLVQAG